jgi:hypothetical protein
MNLHDAMKTVNITLLMVPVAEDNIAERDGMQAMILLGFCGNDPLSMTGTMMTNIKLKL